MGLILPLAAFGLSIGDRVDSVRAYSHILIDLSFHHSCFSRKTIAVICLVV
ncbi:hypothetical protein IQ244_10655 [Nostoc sp. LEGE 06077]|nr:hypothetical protein [Nostoc sp. LEGE 06077]